jgi:hypothetical protein
MPEKPIWLTEINRQILMEALDILLDKWTEMASDMNVPLDRDLERKMEAAEEMWLEITGSQWHK